MAELRSSTSIGGNLAWHTGNLRFDTQGNTIRYAGFKLYSENDKPTTTELNVYSKQESDTKYALVSGANYVSKTLNESMAGSLTVNGNELAVTGFAPRVSLTESDTGKTWWTVADGNDFSIRESTLGNIVFNISSGGTGVNFNANAFRLNAKEAINGADSWLRLNGGGAFTSGIFIPGLVRVDGTIQTGESTGTGLYVNTSAFSWKGTEVFTANNYTTLDARFVNATGDTMTGPLVIQYNNASSNGIKLVNDADGWTWIRMGKSALTGAGDFAWHTGPVEGHAANAFHFRPKGSNTVLGISTGAATIGSDSYLEFLPNSSWGAKLRVGGNGRTATNDGLTASVSTTNGNVHIDSASGSRGVYLNFYAGTAGTVFGNGAGATVGTVDAAGNMSMNGTITAPRVQTGTINGSGSSIGWASIDVTGIKGTYSGINFPSVGHWFGINAAGLAGVWDSAGTSKWYFEANGQLGGGATVLWNSVTSKPGRSNWASYGDALATTVGQLAWKNYGNGHTIFDASAGTSPDGTAVDKNNAQIAWTSAYPTLMGWNGNATYGVRVDSARIADAAYTADRITGTVATTGQDLTIHGKRAMVGANASNQLIINYGNDWGSTVIAGNVFTGQTQSDKLVVINGGSSSYSDAGVEVRVTDGATQTPRIAMHRPGICAAAFRLDYDNTVVLETANPGALGSLVANNMYSNAGNTGIANQLTRTDYVNSIVNGRNVHSWKGQKGDANASFGLGSYIWHPTVANPPISNTFAHGFQFGGTDYASGQWVSDIAFIHGNGLYHRANINGSFANWSKFAFAQEVNYTATPTQYRSTSSWIGLVSGVNGADAVVLGTNSGAATIGAHSNGLDAWAPLYINCHPNSGTTAPLVLSAPKVKLPDNNTLYDVWHRGIFDPGTKLDNGGHGDTLHLSNWFRSSGATGWYNETYGGGIWMDEATTVKVFNGKKFGVTNTDWDSIKTTGGIYAFNNITLDTRATVGVGGSFAVYRYKDAPLHAGFGGLNVDSFAPIVGSANSTNGHGYTTRVHLGVLTPGADGWSSAALMVGSAENDSHPLAIYKFDAYSNISGINNVTANTYNGYTFDVFTSNSTIALRDASGDLHCRILRSGHPDVSFMSGGLAFRSTSATDNNFVHFCNSPAAVRTWLGAPSTAVATAYDTGLMSSNDKAKLNNIAADKSPTETVLWSGLTTAHPTNNQIQLQFSVAGYNKLRFEFVNAGDTIGMVQTLSVSDWATMTGTGRLIHIAIGSYSYTFSAAAYAATVLYRNTSANCYLIRIVGLK